LKTKEKYDGLIVGFNELIFDGAHHLVDVNRLI